MKQDDLYTQVKYPWKSFLLFLGIYLLAVVTQYPIMFEQAKVYIEIFGEDFMYSAGQFAMIALFQPALFGIVAIYFGHRYAPQVHLRSLVSERVETRQLKSTRKKKKITFKESIPFIITGAVLVASLELGFDVVFQNWLPDLYQPSFAIPTIPEALYSIFYDGLGQELLLRWGVMTSIVYVLSVKGERLNEWSYIIGFVFTAILFAFAQYSSVSGYIDLSAIVLFRVLVLLGLPGILYGWLYSSFHIEAAVLSHMLANTLVVFGHSVIVGLSEI